MLKGISFGRQHRYGYGRVKCGPKHLVEGPQAQAQSLSSDPGSLDSECVKGRAKQGAGRAVKKIWWLEFSGGRLHAGALA